MAGDRGTGSATSWAAAIPEIVKERARIEDAARQEEERFAETLDSGMRRIDEYAEVAGRPGPRPSDARVPGQFLFTLYDTYGFPRDLAEEILQDEGWRVTDETQAVDETEMEAQRERARAGATFGGDGDASESDAAALPDALRASSPRSSSSATRR